MKKILTLLLFFLLVKTYAFAAVTAADTAADNKKTKLINKMTVDLDIITAQAKGLSAAILALPIGDTLRRGYWAPLNSAVGKLKNAEHQLVTDSATMHTAMSGTETSGFKDQFSDLDDALADVGDRLSGVKNDTTISSFGQGYLYNPVSRLLSVTAGFKQYLQSLIPPKPDELLPAIMKQFEQTNDKIGDNSNRIDDLKQLTAREVKRVKDSLNILDRKVNTVIGLLQAGGSGKQYILANAYADNVFGIAYLHGLTKTDYLGAELVFPVQSGHVPDAGAFLLYGLRDNKLLLQAGLGYLKNTQSREDVSWKAGILYSPTKMGIGISYSPLTGGGITLAYRW